VLKFPDEERLRAGRCPFEHNADTWTPSVTTSVAPTASKVSEKKEVNTRDAILYVAKKPTPLISLMMKAASTSEILVNCIVLRGVATQQTAIFKHAAVRTSNHTKCC
jgi:hypothetical protein